MKCSGGAAPFMAAPPPKGASQREQTRYCTRMILPVEGTPFRLRMNSW